MAKTQPVRSEHPEECTYVHSVVNVRPNTPDVEAWVKEGVSKDVLTTQNGRVEPTSEATRSAAPVTVTRMRPITPDIEACVKECALENVLTTPDVCVHPTYEVARSAAPVTVTHMKPNTPDVEACVKECASEDALIAPVAACSMASVSATRKRPTTLHHSVRDSASELGGSRLARNVDGAAIRNRSGRKQLLPRVSETHAAWTARVESMADQMTALAQRWSTAAPSRASFRTLALEAMSVADREYGEAEALSWANGFVIPSADRTRDLEEFIACSGCIATMARRRTNQLQGQRFTRTRARAALQSDNPHLLAVLDVADGVPVFTGPGFVCNSTAASLPPQKSTYMRLAPAVNKAFYESHIATGVGFVLPLRQLRSANAIFHVSQAGWTTKYGKPSGRPLTDATAAARGYCALNSDTVAHWYETRYGTIRHPTIGDIARIVLAAQARFPGEEIVVWAKDISGAYTQLSFRADEVHRMAVQLDNEDVLFFIGGIFGFTGMPFAFDPLTRAIRWELQRAINGTVEIYTDDIMGATCRRLVEHDMALADRLLVALFNDTAVARHKDRVGSSADVIGYAIDVPRQLVTIAQKNVMRALYGFLVVDTSAPVAVSLLERLAAWGSRYSEICTFLRPLTHTLFAAFRGRNRHAHVHLCANTRVVVEAFRAALALTVLQARTYTRSLSSFALSGAQPTTVIAFDGSLIGAGAVVYTSVSGVATPVGWTALDLTGWEVQGKPEFQNTAELTAVAAGILCAVASGVSVDNVVLEGDSMTALKWAETQRTHSMNARNAGVALALLAIIHRVGVKRVTHIPAETNWLCDGLSRGRAWADLTAGLGSTYNKTAEAYYDKDRLIRACNPFEPFDIASDLYVEAITSLGHHI